MNNKNKSNKSLVILICVLSVLIVAIVAVMLISGLSELKNEDFTSSTLISQTEDKQIPPVETKPVGEPVDTSNLEKTNIIVEMTDGQSFTMEVYPEIAPKTVENFLSLVNDGFYDGLTFHRIIEGFMAQGGDPEGTGMGGSDKKIMGEFASNGFENNLSHQRGVVSMARSNDPNSASSQFFICYDDATFLDGEYAAFGKVTEGMEVVDSFLSAGTDETDRPLKEVKIKSMKVIG